LNTIVCREEEYLRVRSRSVVAARLGRARDQNGSARFGPTREIEEIVVLSESIKIVRTFGLHRREEDYDTRASFGSQCLPASAVVSV
jgi:hypothetical protein